MLATLQLPTTWIGIVWISVSKLVVTCDLLLNYSSKQPLISRVKLMAYSGSRSNAGIMIFFE